MFVTTYLVAVCFAARNKKDMVEGGFFFFAGQFVLFLIGKNSYSSFKSNFFFHFVLSIIYKGDFFKIIDPKILFPILLKILFSMKIRGEMRNPWNENDKYV